MRVVTLSYTQLRPRCARGRTPRARRSCGRVTLMLPKPPSTSRGTRPGAPLQRPRPSPARRRRGRPAGRAQQREAEHLRGVGVPEALTVDRGDDRAAAAPRFMVSRTGTPSRPPTGWSPDDPRRDGRGPRGQGRAARHRAPVPSRPPPPCRPAHRARSGPTGSAPHHLPPSERGVPRVVAVAPAQVVGPRRRPPRRGSRGAPSSAASAWSSTQRPRSTRYCFGTSAPIRRPLPAAGTTAQSARRRSPRLSPRARRSGRRSRPP